MHSVRLILIFKLVFGKSEWPNKYTTPSDLNDNFTHVLYPVILVKLCNITYLILRNITSKIK